MVVWLCIVIVFEYKLIGDFVRFYVMLSYAARFESFRIFGAAAMKTKSDARGMG